jgi:hypothetical protein
MGERLTTIEATVRLCWHLIHGEAMTTAQAAELIGYSRQGAWQMLCAVSRYMPVFQDDEGLWQLVESGECR